MALVTDVAVATQKAPLLAPLALDVEQIKGELAPIVSGVSSTSDVSPEMKQKVDMLLSDLMSVRPDDVEKQEQWKTVVEHAGSDVAKRSSGRAAMLRRQIKGFANKSAENGTIAKSLIDLSMQVQELNPNVISFNVGGLGKLFGKLPLIGTPVQRYFKKYETADAIIDGIMGSLNAGAETLTRDNVTLKGDQVELRFDTLKLRKVIALLILLDQELSRKIELEIPADDPRRAFLEEEILFPLRKVIQGRQELLLACQQGVISYELLMRNNKELIRGVRHANEVTLRALEIAVTIALGLYDQEMVLKSLQQVDKVTSDILAGTSARLRQQGVEIHKRASDAGLDPEKLKQSFADLNQALVDVATYRRNALPKIAAQILAFNEMAEKGEKAIRQIEAGHVARGTMRIDENLLEDAAAA